MGMPFSQNVDNAFNAGNSGPGISMPGFQEGFQDGNPELTTQGFTETLTGAPPGFQTTYQLAGYNSLEAMKDATDPGWRTSPAQIGMTGGMPQPTLTTMTSGPLTGGNLNDVYGNPISGGPFGTQNVMASPRPQVGGVPQVGFGGKSMPASAPGLSTQQMAQPRFAPRPAPMAAPRVAPRINQGIIPVAQNARRVNVATPNPFTRPRRR